jgi:hypothetical protein
MISNTNNTALTIGKTKTTPVEVVTTKGILIDNFIDEVTDTTPTFKRLQEMWAELHPEDKPPEEYELAMSNVDKVKHIMDGISVTCTDENGEPIEGGEQAEILNVRRLSFMTLVEIIKNKLVHPNGGYMMRFNGVPEEVKLREATFIGNEEVVRVTRNNGKIFSFSRYHYENDTACSVYFVDNF